MRASGAFACSALYSSTFTVPFHFHLWLLEAGSFVLPARVTLRLLSCRAESASAAAAVVGLSHSAACPVENSLNLLLVPTAFFLHACMSLLKTSQLEAADQLFSQT